MLKKTTTLLSFLLFSFYFQAQVFIQTYQDRANQVSQSTITTYLQEFEALGVKRTGTIQNTNTLNWLKDKYMALGYDNSAFQEHAWTASGYSSKNLIVTKTGTTYPNKYVIVCGHFDSINGPGVNDNGSGTSIILEIARILKDVPTDYSIKFIHFSGEEQGLLGSSRYVSQVVNGTNPKMDIKVVVNLDQLGGLANKSNTKVYCDQDQSNPSSNNAAAAIAVQELATCTQLYSPLEVAFDKAENTDYVPFQANGEVITGYFEYEGGYNNPYVHTANDKLVNMDPVYVYNLAKAAVGAIQHFAVATTSPMSVDETAIKKELDNLNIYPNPAKNYISINVDEHKYKNLIITINDLSGKQLLIKKENFHLIDISSLTPGIYMVNLNFKNYTTTKKLIIK